MDMMMKTPWYISLVSILFFASMLACGTPSSSTPPQKDATSDMVDASEDQPLDDMSDMTPPKDMVGDSREDLVDMPVADMTDMFGTEEPLALPSNEWTWVDFPDSACGNGQPTGIGINKSETSKDILVFMQGGGACWDVNTCFVLKSAANLETGYGEANFDRESAKNALLFNRQDADNPFKDATYVFMPYCTGDLHNGDRIKRYTALGQVRDIHHRGAHNVKQFLSRLAPTFPGSRTIYLSGSSAGGYGAQFNYERFVRAMPEAEIHLMADSAPLVQPYDGRFGAMRAAWDFQVEQDCTSCDTQLYSWVPHLVSKYPKRRFGLLAYDEDEVIRVYFGYPIDPTPFKNRLKILTRDHYMPASNAQIFIRPGTAHVMLKAPRTVQQGDVVLLDWLRWWKEGDAKWVSVQ